MKILYIVDKLMGW